MHGFNAKLLFTDTDSLTYEITTHDVYDDMHASLNEYDTSDYPKSHFLYHNANAKVLGKFKDETLSVVPIEFVGFRFKMYSLLLPEDKSKSAVKGIKKSFARKSIRHEHFKHCILSNEISKAAFYSIRSFSQRLQTVLVVKDSQPARRKEIPNVARTRYFIVRALAYAS